MYLSYETTQGFAEKRNPDLSFTYLKENGELLCVARAEGFLVEPRVSELYRDFYTKAFQIVETYPQYYRFILGIVLDLEDLSLSSNKDVGSKLCEYVREQQLIRFDTSDSRRLEALTLTKRRQRLNIDEQSVYSHTKENIARFVSNPTRFTKFNKPLFYELTHFVFFLTDYGRSSISDMPALADCLFNIGLLALLDHDADLLAETSICLRYIGHDTPSHWISFLETSYRSLDVSYECFLQSAMNTAVDEYHLYLVLNWQRACHKLPNFEHSFRSRRPSFSISSREESLLSKLSTYLHEYLIGGQDKTKANLVHFMSVLSEAEQNFFQNSLKSSPHSPKLLAGFSNFIFNI